MRVQLIANAPMPTERAHGVQLAHMAAAFSGLGCRVDLVVPDSTGTTGRDVAAFYGLEGDFTVRRLGSLSGAARLRARRGVPVPARRLLRDAERLAFVSAAIRQAREGRPDLVLSRDEVVAAALSSDPTGPVRALYELHKFPVRGLPAYDALLRRCAGVVSTNRYKQQALLQRAGLAADRVLLAPNTTDVRAFSTAAPRPGLRAELGLPASARLVLYVGHLYAWKGVQTLVAAAELLPDDTHVLLLGGVDADVARYRRDHAGPRLHVPGPRPHAEVPGWLAAADLLVLPNTAKSQEGRLETSPLKLFEYMASGRPIVATDLPSLREHLDDDRALLVPPDDPAALAAGITVLLDDPRRAEALGARARAAVQGQGWEARARRILDFAQGLRTRG